MCSSVVLVNIFIIDGPKNDAACVLRYFNGAENQETQDDASDELIYKGYKAVLDSKSKDETLVTLVPFPDSEVENFQSWCFCGSRSYKDVKLNRHCKQVGSQDGQHFGTESHGGNIQ